MYTAMYLDLLLYRHDCSHLEYCSLIGGAYRLPKPRRKNLGTVIFGLLKTNVIRYRRRDNVRVYFEYENISKKYSIFAVLETLYLQMQIPTYLPTYYSPNHRCPLSHFIRKHYAILDTNFDYFDPVRG